MVLHISVPRQTTGKILQAGSPESTNLGHSASDDSNAFLWLASILWFYSASQCPSRTILNFCHIFCLFLPPRYCERQAPLPCKNVCHTLLQEETSWRHLLSRSTTGLGKKKERRKKKNKSVWAELLALLFSPLHNLAMTCRASWVKSL